MQILTMDINKVLLISSMVFQLIAELRRSGCTDIEISDCIKIHRDVIDEDASPM